ncbi:MAG: SGNH/GDSL hydrolase family protein [Verrucomicrobiia bacterium]
MKTRLSLLFASTWACRTAPRPQSAPALVVLIVWVIATFSGASALAQPTITTQPKSLAVLLSSNATFRVTATGTAPLVYQWQLDGRELAGATNASLVVSNVALADLGSYTVVVRDANGQGKSQPAWLKLARWRELVVFDASICMASYSNGKSWVEWLGERLCLSASGQVRNYATGGATCADVRSQIATYLRSYTPDANTLLAPWWAGMAADLLWAMRPVNQVVSDFGANLAQLAEGGGRIFILPTLVPLYLNPGLDSPYARSLDYQDINARMNQEIQKIQSEYGVTVFRFDYSQLCSNLLADPAAYGFTNVTSAAMNQCPPGDASRFLWWDGIHPTTALHHAMSEETYRCLTPPLVMALPTGGASGVLDLQWQSGSPPFRLQRCADLATGSWQSDELDFATNATTVSSAPQEYFRVLQLGQ